MDSRKPTSVCGYIFAAQAVSIRSVNRTAFGRPVFSWYDPGWLAGPFHWIAFSGTCWSLHKKTKTIFAKQGGRFETALRARSRRQHAIDGCAGSLNKAPSTLSLFLAPASLRFSFRLNILKQVTNEFGCALLRD